MDKGHFKSNLTGRLVFEQKGLYFHFEPKALPFKYKPDLKMNNLLMETALKLGELNGITKRFSRKEINLLKMPFILKEATFSSRIEGTRSTLTDVYKGKKEKEKDLMKRLDNEEINNYYKALNLGLSLLRNQDLNEGIIKEIHKVLLKGVRGKEKSPGEYKKIQNAIGMSNDTLETAKFVPASPETTPYLMKNLIDFFNNNKTYNPLFKIGIIHYQFEAIHPFRDGNGRLGRLLIILLLCKEKIIDEPFLYISEYFNRYRDKYLELLYKVSVEGTIEEWLRFFLEALRVQSEKSLNLTIKLLDYKSKLHEKIKVKYRSTNIYNVIDLLFENPFITIGDIQKKLKISFTAASKIIRKLIDEDILIEFKTNKKNKLFLAKEIIDILEKGV